MMTGLSITYYDHHFSFKHFCFHYHTPFDQRDHPGFPSLYDHNFLVNYTNWTRECPFGRGHVIYSDTFESEVNVLYFVQSLWHEAATKFKDAWDRQDFGFEMEDYNFILGRRHFGRPIATICNDYLTHADERVFQFQNAPQFRSKMVELANSFLDGRTSDFVLIASLMGAQEESYYGSRRKARFIMDDIRLRDATQVRLCNTFTAIHNKKQVRDVFDELGLKILCSMMCTWEPSQPMRDVLNAWASVFLV